MATVVPVSHSHRWRSRSRNQSSDSMQLYIHVPTARDDHGGGDDSDRSDDESDAFDSVQTSPWLVVPQGFVSPIQQRSSALSPAPPAPHGSWQKAMEMRRASGF